MTIDQILWLELVLKLSAGLTLLLVPGPAIYLAGMPPSAAQSWPRYLGAVLIGIGAAIFIQLKSPAANVIGPAGLCAINFAGAGVMAAHLILGQAATTRRGRLFVLANALLLFAFAFVELAYA